MRLLFFLAKVWFAVVTFRRLPHRNRFPRQFPIRSAYCGGMYGSPGKKFHHRHTGNVAVAACVIDLMAANDGKVPTSFRLMPAGRTRARDGRPHEVPDGWYLDEQVAQGVLAFAAAQKDDFLIDYEHQTFHTVNNGVPAPAAGWAKGSSLEYRAGNEPGIYINDVDWNEDALKAIVAKEYRYISPVIAYDRKTGYVLAILMAALTNYAAIDGLSDMAATAAARFSFDNPTEEENTVDRKQLIKLLGLADDATDEQINQAIAANKAAFETVTALRTDLEVDEKGDVQVAVAALKTAVAAKGDEEPDPSKFVPINVMESLKTEVAALRSEINGKEIDELVESALGDGRLLPKQEEWARKLGTSDIAALRTYLKDATPIPGLKKNQTEGKSPEGLDEKGELTSDALAMCRSMNIDPEDYKKTLAAG